jgi:hypothetical protein
VVAQMRAKRFALALDARAAAAILIAAYVPVRCAVMAEIASRDGQRTFRAFLALAAERLRGGMWYMLRELVQSAAADGYVDALELLSRELLAEARALRDRALESPPDPVEFSRRLFDIPPYADATRWICQWTRECGAGVEETWACRQTQAEEVAVRAGEGLCAQYINWITGHHLSERRLVEAAHVRGDRRAVFRMLREGENRCMRPRSYRPFLEGRGPAPAIVS